MKYLGAAIFFCLTGGQPNAVFAADNSTSATANEKCKTELSAVGRVRAELNYYRYLSSARPWGVSVAVELAKAAASSGLPKSEVLKLYDDIKAERFHSDNYPLELAKAALIGKLSA